MAEVQYFICHASEDGGASINEYSEDELKDLLSWDDDSKQIGLIRRRIKRFVIMGRR
jgi:hypothetical protein